MTAEAPDFAKKLFIAHLEQLKRLTDRRGISGLQKLYKEARADLYDRLRRTGRPDTAATPTVLKAMIGQASGVLSILGDDLEGHLSDVGRAAAELGATHAGAEYKALEENFRGTTPVLNLDDAAVFSGMVDDVEPSLLRRHSLLAKTWSLGAIHNMEHRLSIGAMAGKPIFEMVNDVMGDNGLMEQERYRAERVVRTEMAYAHGATKFAAMQKASEDLDDDQMQKRLIETFDERTGDDSFLVHGQTVPLNEPFTWKHKVQGRWMVTEYMHPPNRPNDRAVVIPWDPSWEETGEEAPLTIADLRSAAPTRWRAHVGVEIPPGHHPGKSYNDTGKAKKEAPKKKREKEVPTEATEETREPEPIEPEVLPPVVPEPIPPPPERYRAEPIPPPPEEEPEVVDVPVAKPRAKAARSKASASAHPTLTAKYAPSQASFAISNEKIAVEAARNLFGRKVTMEDLASVSGMSDGDIQIRPVTWNAGGEQRYAITVTATRKDEGASIYMQRTLGKKDGKLVLHNDIFEITGETGKGAGTKLFAQQVAQARRMGISHIETEAARSEGKFNGYYTWPRLGYDGEVNYDKIAHVGRAIMEDTGYKHVREFMETEEGRELWKKWGHWIDCEFDLSDGSYSMRALEKYMEKKK